MDKRTEELLERWAAACIDAKEACKGDVGLTVQKATRAIWAARPIILAGPLVVGGRVWLHVASMVGLFDTWIGCARNQAHRELLEVMIIAEGERFSDEAAPDIAQLEPVRRPTLWKALSAWWWPRG